MSAAGGTLRHMSTPPKVPVGPATVAGYGLAIAGIVTSVLTAVTASEAQLHGPGKWAAILGVVSALVTGTGRQLQGFGVQLRMPAAVTETIDALPTLAQELESPPPPAMVAPESAAVPDGAVPAPPTVPVATS